MKNNNIKQNLILIFAIIFFVLSIVLSIFVFVYEPNNENDLLIKTELKEETDNETNLKETAKLVLETTETNDDFQDKAAAKKKIEVNVPVELEAIDYLEETWKQENNFTNFDYEKEYQDLEMALGKDAMAIIPQTLFVGHSFCDRLVRPIDPYVSKFIRASGFIEMYEDMFYKNTFVGKKYVVHQFAYIMGQGQQTYNEYKAEWEFFREKYKKKGVEEIFICPYFGGEYYDTWSKKLCEEYEDMHYIDFGEFDYKKYFENDGGHFASVFNRIALKKVISEVYNITLDKKDNTEIEEKRIIDKRKIKNKLSENDKIEQNADDTFPLNENIQIGNIVKFGNYDGLPIRWVVIAKNEYMVLLFAEKIIDTSISGPSDVNDYSETNIKKFLELMYENSFTEDEKYKISSFPITTKKNKLKETDKDIENPETKTENEHIFLLSYAEMVNNIDLNDSLNKYKIGKGTAHALNNDLFFAENEYFSSPYWLRDNGFIAGYMQAVDVDGNYRTAGHSLLREDIGVRPAMWVRAY